MADGKMEEDGEFFWMKCMVVRIKQTDPERDHWNRPGMLTKKQALRLSPHSYAPRDSQFEQLAYIVEHAEDWRWEIGWTADTNEIRKFKEGCERRGEEPPPHDALFDFFKRENVFLMAKIPAVRAVEYRMRFIG